MSTLLGAIELMALGTCLFGLHEFIEWPWQRKDDE